MAKAAAEAESRSKSNFLGYMGHTVRTPVEGAVGLTELLERTGLTADQVSLVGAIRDSAQNLLHGINDLLDFSRLEAGKLRLEMATFDLRQVVEGTLQQLQVQAQEKEIGLTCEIAADVPGWIYGDRIRLGQVLGNIVSNAVKFTEQGRVDVRVSVAEYGERRAQLCFTVTDSGIGISRETQRTLFDAFVQFEAGGARKYGSSGLGLALCKGLLHVMAGEIRVISEPGAGSTFEFTASVGVAQRGSTAQPGVEQQRAFEMPVKRDSDPHEAALAIADAQGATHEKKVKVNVKEKLSVALNK
jgi:signal transduction histidine kinase